MSDEEFDELVNELKENFERILPDKSKFEK